MYLVRHRYIELASPKKPPRCNSSPHLKLAILARMVFLRAVGITLLLPVCCSAQQPEPVAKGTVTGRVICADTNLPARLANVVLQPVVDNTPTLKIAGGKDRPHVVTTTLVETLLDGSFIVPNVVPGDYYVFVEKPGYISPFALVSREDLNHPSSSTADLIARFLTSVSVVANRTSTVEVRIFKGASISGTVSFDDGSPNPNAGIELLTKDKTGKWTSFRAKPLGSFGPNSTDDQGRYRISGLPRGEYIVKTTLALSDIAVDRVFGQERSFSNNPRYSLDIFSGDGLRQRDAKPVKLEEGEESGAVDIAIPISKLHAVSGSVIEASTGHVINAGSVAIVYPDDDTQLVSTEISKDDDAFHFYFVPEGEYTLKVTHAREVSREEISNGPGTFPATSTVEKKLRDFDVPPQPIIINGDMTGIIVPAQLRPTSTAPAKSQ